MAARYTSKDPTIPRSNLDATPLNSTGETEDDASGGLLELEDAATGEYVTAVPLFVGVAAPKKAPDDLPCQLQVVVPGLTLDLGE